MYKTIQAKRKQLSHFNQSAPFYIFMYSLMGFATTVVTLYTAYVGLLFCLTRFPNLPGYYIWSIRFGILVFVVFAFEGFVMGSRLTHIIGGEMGG